jgi:hypothetical protein
MLLVTQFIGDFKETLVRQWSLELTERLPQLLGNEKLVATRLSIIRHIDKGLGRTGGKSGGLMAQYLYRNAMPSIVDDVRNHLSELRNTEATWGDSDVMRVEDISTLSQESNESTGILYLAVFFKGYRDNYQNDSRKNLLNSFPAYIAKNFPGVRIVPLAFSLVYGTLDGSGRAVGAQYQYSFKGMDTVQPKDFINVVNKFAKKEIWDSSDVLFARLR